MKRFLAFLFLAVLVILAGYLIYSREKSGNFENDPAKLHKASFFERLAGNLVQCSLCPNRCTLSEGQIGLCKARKNIGGELYSLSYNRISSEHVDPIEKKPFFHVLPGAKAYSISSTGCNMRCLYCQNWNISQVFPWEVETKEMSPEEAVQNAKANGSEFIVFTYNEPTTFYEYMLDTAKLAKENGLKTAVVSSGYINPEPLRQLLKYIDAYKVDLKAFREGFYQKFTGGHLEPVLKTMKIIKEEGVWLEIVNLLIPGENDSEQEVREMARWIKENLGNDVPLHFSRFTPLYKLQNLPPTPVETIINARRWAKEEGLLFVYTGNIVYPEGETTFCPESREKVIEREGFTILFNKLQDGRCLDGEKIPGIWSR